MEVRASNNFLLSFISAWICSLGVSRITHLFPRLERLYVFHHRQRSSTCLCLPAKCAEAWDLRNPTSSGRVGTHSLSPLHFHFACRSFAHPLLDPFIPSYNSSILRNPYVFYGKTLATH